MTEPKHISCLRHSVLLLFAGISIYPVIRVFSISLRPGNQLQSTDLSILPDGWTWNSYIQLFTEQPFLRWLGNSLLVAILVTLTGVALAAMGGYALSRYRFVGRQTTMLAILTTQMFPATMLLLPLYILIAKLGLVNTYLGLMVFMLAILYAIYAIIMHFTGHTNPGWTSLLITILFLGGVQLFSIGVIGEYIARIFNETKARPHYFISDRTD